jgi:cobalamin biosynthesis protein CobT
VLTTAFLALAAGGTAACDASSDEFDPTGSGVEYDGYDSGSDSSYSDDSGSDSYDSSDDSDSYDSSDEFDDGGYDDSDGSESSEQVFYCADEDGTIAEEDRCEDDSGSGYFLWHSAGFARGMVPGDVLDGGSRFPATDRKARTAFKLPPTGTVPNGTIKTNVVGSGSRAGGGTGSSGSSGG